MTKPTVVVLDYGSGNIHSAAKAAERAGAIVEVTAERDRVLAADGLIVPGVGAFEAVMTQLNAVNGGALIEKRLIANKPVLGICVAMQVLFEHGVERGNDVPGLGEWPGVVELLKAPILPHVGWNTVEPEVGSALFAGVEAERFYFVHSYGAQHWTLDPQPPFVRPILTWADHGGRFLAAVENGPLSATQFHPEKSGGPGIRLLANWLETLKDRA